MPANSDISGKDLMQENWKKIKQNPSCFCRRTSS